MLRKLFLAVVLTSITTLATATPVKSNDVLAPKVGEVLVINAPHHFNAYHYINFPPLHTLVKRGHLASYKDEFNTPVVVEKIEKDNDGNPIVTLSRKDGKKFFKMYNTITCEYSDAIAHGELSIQQ
ncbi:hypothetical protein ACG2LH_00300 [Zhouia sp. PK063]|uniref:hypothetical protein n=1 Tax=Zhouia sp. PK063 TaxID=3373602 RepID=UPI0037BA55D8